MQKRKDVITAIKFFDMFSGIGGFRSGLEQAGGFECVGFCEIDCHAATAYRAMYETRKEAYYSDITRIDTGEMPDFDLLVGGFPCQAFSCSGKMAGFDDPRGALFFDLARIIKNKRPAAFLLENVPALIGHQSGQTFGTILCTLSELGYCVEWMVHNSACFGVPQSRRRVYIVGHRHPECAGKIFPVKCGNCKTPVELIGGPQGSRVYSAKGTAITQCAGAGGAGAKTGLYFFDMNPEPEFTENARCLIARYDSGIGNHKGVNSGVFVEGDCSNAVTDSKGNDDETVTVRPDGEEETELPETLTLLVTPMQANILAELEAEGEIHVALVYRGSAENAQKFITAQANLLEELTSENEKEKDTAEGAAQEKELQGEAAEEKHESEKHEIESVVIIPETTEEITAETEGTEVTTNG